MHYQKKEIEVKAAEYDKLEEKKIQLLETPNPFKKLLKKLKWKKRYKKKETS